MANNRYHKRRIWSTKKIRKRDEEISNRIGYPERDKSKIPFHYLAKKYKVTYHAIYRFAERVLNIDTDSIGFPEARQIAKTIQGSLPNEIISGARYNIFDNYFAIIGNDMVITIIESK